MLRPLGRPKSISNDSSIDFGLILASFFHQKIILFRKSPKARKPWKNIEKSMILHLKASHIRIDFWSKFHACSKRLPKPLFSTLWPPKCTKKSPYWIFWTVFGAQSDFQGSPKSPKIAQEAPKYLTILCLALARWPTCSRRRFRSAPGHHFGRCWMDFGWILNEFWWILASFFKDFGHVSAAAFAECQRCMARNVITENVNNMQITAEICKNRTQPKTQTSKLQSIVSKLQNAVSSHP